jgi:hypothetical protein
LRQGAGAYRSSSADLLDLVRTAEDEARLAIRKRTPATPMTPPKVPSRPSAGGDDEFVDVGDEAVDAPPSLPPLHLATPAGAFAARGPAQTAVARATAPRGLWPVLAILLLLALGIGALALVTR